MKVAFVSTRGIPNYYGGLEEFVENLSVRLVAHGLEVIVYNPCFHPYKESDYRGVRIKHIYSSEKKIGAAANFIYDYLSLRDAIRERCDVILICGYTTSAIWFLFQRYQPSVLITNIDGLEWKRAKHSQLVQWITRWFESIAVKKSSHVISDNPGIQEYVKVRYGMESTCIAYAATPYPVNDTSILETTGLKSGHYFLLIGRLEPENNIEMILDGIISANDLTPVHLFAGTENRYARYLMKKYRSYERIRFRGWLSGQDKLAVIRHYARLYFHGHSVGGTNPSLLEAMAAGAFIAAHDNVFNRHVLGPNALYFDSAERVKAIIENLNHYESDRPRFIAENLKVIVEKYNWDVITEKYLNLFLQLTSRKNN
jgi:glycosyltransferase involved in cell wall biosynthesis